MADGSVTTALDFYGPFLEGDQILYQHDPEADPLILVRLGDFTLQVEGMESAYIPNKHARFILNALLSQPDGELPYEEIVEMGFYAGRNKASIPSALSTTVKNLTGILDEYRNPILGKLKQGVNVSVQLSSELEIIRLVNGELSTSALDEVPLRQEDFDNILDLVAALREYMSGKGPRIDYDGTSPRAIEQARKALRLAHSDYKKHSKAEERFIEQSRILASLSNGVQPPPEGTTIRRTGGYSTQFLKDMFAGTTIDGDKSP